MSRSPEAKRRRSRIKNERRKIQSAFYHLLFEGIAPKKVTDLRKALKTELDERESHITLKVLNEHQKVWHPKHRDLEGVYRCYGGLIGTYMPSAESRKKGIFVLKDNKGVLPFELSKDFSYRVKRRIAPKDGSVVTNQKYCCWLVGTKEAPFYNIISVRPEWTSCSFIRYEGHFRVQGKITSQNKDKVSVLIDSEKISHNIIVHRFPHKITKKEFWVMDCVFEEGELRFKRGVKLGKEG